MEIGSIMEIMVMCGFLTRQTSGLIIPMDIGFTPVMDGHGFPITVGVGLRFIMADG